MSIAIEGASVSQNSARIPLRSQQCTSLAQASWYHCTTMPSQPGRARQRRWHSSWVMLLASGSHADAAAAPLFA